MDSSVIWIGSAIVAGFSMLIAGVQWWSSRTDFVRVELQLLDLRIQLEGSRNVDEPA